MHVIVCVKQIPDPEAPLDVFRIDPATSRPVQDTTRMVMDGYAENALEMAIQLREQGVAKRVTALCLGDKPAEEVLRRALSFTADAAVRAWDPAWSVLDGPGVAHVLARAIGAIGGADLVLAGRQAGDVEEGLVGPVLAEELGSPCVTLVSTIAAAGSPLQVTREIDGGYAVMSVPLPAVCTVTSSAANVPRFPKTRDVLMARGKPIRLLSAAEVNADPERIVPGVRLERVYVPVSSVHCEILLGQEGPDQARALASRIQELKVL